MLHLQQDLESLKVEQRKEQSVFGEIQSILSKLMAAHSAETHPRPDRMTDNTVQTSPSLVGMFCVASEEKHNYEGMRLCTGAITHSEERVACSVCPAKAKSTEKLNTGASFQVSDHVAIEKQLFNHTLAEKSYCTRSVMTSASSPVVTTAVIAEYMVGAPVHMKLLNPINDIDANTFRQNKFPKRGQRRQHFRKKRALVLPQRRQNNRMVSVNVFEDSQHDEEQENRVPLSTISSPSKNPLPTAKQQGTAGSMNRGKCGRHLHPCSWCQSSNSSQMSVEYEKVEQGTVMPEHKPNTKMRQGGMWQLFDFTSDSD